MTNLLEHIETNPKIMAGKPIIKGTRLTVQFILGLLSHGQTMEMILKEYDYITADDIFACFEFAS